MIKTRLQRACPVCKNSAGAELLHTQSFVLPDAHPLPPEYDIVACGGCGFVYADTPADQAAYDKYYAEMAKYDMNYTCPDTSLYVDRAAWIGAVVRNRSASLLDVGCGNGQLLLELRKLGFSGLTALDPSFKCIEAARQHGIAGIVGSVSALSSGGQYDAVTLSGVLEHICDVGKMMRTLKLSLKPGGLLLVCVPDASRYMDYDTVPFDYFNIEHINHFDETSLISLGLFHGFRVVNFLKTSIALSGVEQPMIFCAYSNRDKEPADWLSYSWKMALEYLARTRQNRAGELLIDELYKSGEELVIWGAGNHTSRLLSASNLGKCNIVMLVDNDKHKQGTSLNGKPVRPPEALLDLPTAPTILVSAAVFHAQILAEIKNMGLPNKVAVLR